MPAGHTHVKTRHRFVGTSNLDLVEGCFVAVAILGIALDASLLSVVPRTGSAENVFLLLALIHSAGKDWVGNEMFKGTCPALEAVRALVGQ